MGLINRVVEDGESLPRPCHRAPDRGRAPLVARWHKKFARRCWIHPAVGEENDELRLLRHRGFQIGYSFLNKTKPRFTGR